MMLKDYRLYYYNLRQPEVRVQAENSEEALLGIKAALRDVRCYYAADLVKLDNIQVLENGVWVWVI